MDGGGSGTLGQSSSVVVATLLVKDQTVLNVKNSCPRQLNAFFGGFLGL